MLRTALAALGALLLIAPAAAADVALLDDQRAAGVALAGRDVVVVREHRHARVTVDALNLDGAPVRRILTIPSPGRGWLAGAGVSASAQRVAVLTGFDALDGTVPAAGAAPCPAGEVVLEDHDQRLRGRTLRVARGERAARRRAAHRDSRASGCRRGGSSTAARAEPACHLRA